MKMLNVYGTVQIAMRMWMVVCVFIVNWISYSRYILSRYFIHYRTEDVTACGMFLNFYIPCLRLMRLGSF